MGYYTHYNGDVEITPDMTDAHKDEFEEKYQDEIIWSLGEGKYSGVAALVGPDEEVKGYQDEAELIDLLQNFFGPRGYVLNGTIYTQGEDPEDAGVFKIENNALYRAEYERVLKPYETRYTPDPAPQA